MNRLLTYTAVGLFLGLTPAVAQNDDPVNEPQTPPAMQEPAEPALPSEAVPLDPQEPGAPIPGDSTQVSPGAEEPQLAPSADQPNPAAPPAQTEAQKSLEPSDSPPSDSAMTPSESAPTDSASLASDSPQFLSKQERSDWLASNLIGVAVNNSANESIGSITDLISDENGKVVGVIVGAGGFLGIGQKDVAIRFEDVKLARDANDDVTALVNISQDALASAPDYETLAEQQMTVGADQDRSAPDGL
jgi:PRC-barrel domain